jgi:hypothetical protein
MRYGSATEHGQAEREGRGGGMKRIHMSEYNCYTEGLGGRIVLDSSVVGSNSCWEAATG